MSFDSPSILVEGDAKAVPNGSERSRGWGKPVGTVYRADGYKAELPGKNLSRRGHSTDIGHSSDSLQPGETWRAHGP